MLLYIETLRELNPKILSEIIPSLSEMDPYAGDVEGIYGREFVTASQNTHDLAALTIRDIASFFVSLPTDEASLMFKTATDLAVRAKPDIYARHIDYLQRFGDDLDKLADTCTEYMNLPNSWTKEASPTWANCINVMLRIGRADNAIAILHKFLEIFTIDELAQNLLVANFARENGFTSTAVNLAAAIFEHIQQNRRERSFCRLIENKRIALVGNGPQDLGRARGDEIDAHDIVMRFGNFDVSGILARDYGRRTDIWIHNTKVAESPVGMAGLRMIYLVQDPERYPYTMEQLQLIHSYMRKGILVEAITAAESSAFRKAFAYARPFAGTIAAHVVKSINPHFSIENLYGFSLSDHDLQPHTIQHYFGSPRDFSRTPHKMSNDIAFLRKILSVSDNQSDMKTHSP